MNLPVAIVTGSTGSLGRYVVKRLSEEGFSCICLGSRHPTKIGSKLLQEQLRYVIRGQRHQYMSIDMGVPLPENIVQLGLPGKEYPVRQGEEEMKLLKLFQYKQWQGDNPGVNYTLQLLVNLAGVSQVESSVKISRDSLVRMVNINLVNPMILTQLASRQMLREGKVRGRGTKRPCIINVSSVLSNPGVDVDGTAVYGATKAGLSQYTRLLAGETSSSSLHQHSSSMASKWPRIVEMSLGPVMDSEMVQCLPPERQQHLLSSSPDSTTTCSQVADQVWKYYSSG